MSQENVDRFLACIEVVNRLDEAPELARDAAAHILDSWLAFFDPGVVYEPRQTKLRGARGREALGSRRCCAL
jgi:hypothetical protein